MRVLSTLGVIGLVVALAFGAASTGAWFTDTEKVEDSVLTTGELDLAVGTGQWDFSVGPLKPGNTASDYVTVGFLMVSNTGDYDMKWRGYITLDDNTGNLRDHLVVRCTLNPGDWAGSSSLTKYGPDDALLWTGIPLTDLMSVDNDYFLIGPAAEPFYTGHYAVYRIDVRLKETATNSQQNATLQADLNFQATQDNNTGWTQ